MLQNESRVEWDVKKNLRIIFFKIPKMLNLCSEKKIVYWWCHGIINVTHIYIEDAKVSWHIQDSLVSSKDKISLFWILYAAIKIMLGETYDLKQNLEWVPDLTEERKIPSHLGQFWQSNLCFHSIIGKAGFSPQSKMFLSAVLKALQANQCAATPSGTFKETETPNLSGVPRVSLIPHLSFRVFFLLSKLGQ